jgi:hypothetical protein
MKLPHRHALAGVITEWRRGQNESNHVLSYSPHFWQFGSMPVTAARPESLNQRMVDMFDDRKQTNPDSEPWESEFK